ncbi:hypothetical protein DFH28DRAFT_1225490 [Melampsora americana]|nr:hypothetical protein DFH28DRAFT_1225490 [Melampsora americana]
MFIFLTMRTFVCLWLLAIIIHLGAGHEFRTSKSYKILSNKLESLPKFQPKNSLNQFNPKEKYPSKLLSPSDWDTQRATKLDSWGQISWGIENISESFSYARSLLEVIMYGNQAVGKSENKFISHAMDLLEKEDLNITQRIWILGVLRILQDYSPAIKHPLLSNSIKEGPLCRAGLELSLTQGFDLFLELEKALQNHQNNGGIHPFLLEGLQRVELLGKINRWAQKDGKVKRSEELSTIYDRLLQVDCPIKLDQSIELSKRCLMHMSKEPGSAEERRWTYGVLYHLYSSSKEVREVWKTNLGKPQLQATQQLLSQQMKYKEVVKDDLERYFSNGNPDPFITNLLLPFKDILPVTLKHYIYIIDCFEAQGKKDHPARTTEYWLQISDYHRFAYHKSFVFHILGRASPYIKGAQQYLASRLKIINRRYQYIPLEGSNKANHNKEKLECPICLDEFVLGEHCIKLNCSPKHRFHHRCLVKWMGKFSKQLSLADSPSQHKNCPICRIPIGSTLHPTQHFLWWEDQGIHKTITRGKPGIEGHMTKGGSGLAQGASTSESGSSSLSTKRPRVDDEAEELNTIAEEKRAKVSRV